MKISVVIPSYNQGRFIRQTIDSILAQEGDIEVFVADGGSTDETVEILKSYGQKIQWVSEKDKGQTDAINKGLSRVTGDIVAYINSDDFYMPGVFNKVREVFATHPGVMWVTGDALIVDEEGKEIQRGVRFYKRVLRRLPFPWILYITNPIVQPSTFWRRSLVEEIGLFRQDKHYTMDYDYWLRIIRYYKPYILVEPLSAFRIHGLSKGGRQYEKQFQEDWETVREHCTNPFFLFLHAIHNSLIVGMYRMMKG
ncbi:glycosyltransferase family 2 protein [Thermospira aquatica]|uniref:Glycosyltransferase n=1 Tax=Thermospira aquatica TaxID=2828656 RepID=A0AAX3BET6_9SPIR|nr:glycosyltransferase family 2 protein [Thermospira aquatica]URA10859.1 glycosyltransferase [Thermospira aquatica]